MINQSTEGADGVVAEILQASRTESISGPYRWKGPFQCLVGPRLGVHVYLTLYILRILLVYSYSSANNVLNMIKILFLQKFEVTSVLFIYLLFISIRV